MKNLAAAVALLCASLIPTPSLAQAAAEQPPMSFFITSAGLGSGGDLGGLAGADAHCQALAAGVGRGDSMWRAYLSTQGPGGVNARDRIGAGPWYGAAGNMIARDLSHLHGDTLEDARLGNGLHPFHARTEAGDIVPGILAREYGLGASVHDILTGSRPDGTAYPAGDDQTCSNWTASEGGSARIGHHDRHGRLDNSWNSTHNTQSCSQAGVSAGGGAGLFYCFAID
jgi:hypothetical protein